MKKNLSSLEIHCLLKELGILLGQRIEKIYQPGKKELLMQFHISGKGRHILRVIAGKFIFFAEQKEEAGEPSGFCMLLRKHLGNARLRAINQLESERIVEFVFEAKEGIKILIIELFAQGNIILTDEKYMILSAVEYHTFKDRDIRAKAVYQYPKRPVNIFKLKPGDFKEIIKGSDKESIVKSLAIDIGLGGTYSEETCILAGIDKNTKPKELEDKDINLLFGMLSVLLDKKISPSVIYENNEAVDVIPFDMEIYGKAEKKEFDTFSQALDFYIGLSKQTAKTPKEEHIEKLKRIINQQEDKIKEMEAEEKEVRERAESIYHNYSLIDEILKEIKKARNKYSWAEIKEKLEGHKTIKEVNAKDKRIKVDLQQ